MTEVHLGSLANQETRDISRGLVAKTWTEILRHVDNHPGINISTLTELLQRSKASATSHRLLVSGYVHCMLDIGLLRREDMRLYTNGTSFKTVVDEFTLFKQMLDAKRKKMAEARKQEQRGARMRYYEDDEGWVEE